MPALTLKVESTVTANNANVQVIDFIFWYIKVGEQVGREGERERE